MTTPVSVQSFQKIFASRAQPAAPGFAIRPEWLLEQQRAALLRFEQLGLPTRQNEEWKYTSLKSIAEREFHDGLEIRQDQDGQMLTREILNHLHLEHAVAIVFMNGYLLGFHNLEKVRDVEISHFQDERVLNSETLKSFWNFTVPTTSDSLQALNQALSQDGAYIRVRKDVSVEEPLHVIQVNRGAQVMSTPRSVVVIESGAKITLVESYLSIETKESHENSYFCNSAMSLFVDKNATLDYVRIQSDDESAQHVGRTQIELAAHATVHSMCLSLGGQLTRHNLHINLNGEGAHVALNGLYIAKQKEHNDQHTFLDHKVPNCTSEQTYKGILSDHARAVFNGRIVIQPDAQKTDSKLLNKNLLLSAKAEVDTKPELEIYANDVKASHGATVGQLNRDELFYLESRGIAHDQALQMLARGFAEDLVFRIQNESVRSYALARLDHALTHITDVARVGLADPKGVL